LRHFYGLTCSYSVTKETHVVEETVPVDSFFDIFTPSLATAGGDEEADESDKWLLEMDFDLGEAFEEEIIPRAVDWYTGEAAEDDEYNESKDDLADEGDDDGDDVGEDVDNTDDADSGGDED
jgi:nucleosome assembly protein 1-like 1